LLGHVTYSEWLPALAFCCSDEFVPRIKHKPTNNYELISCTFGLITHTANYSYR